MSESQDQDECYSQIEALITKAQTAKINKAVNAKDILKDAQNAIYRYEGYLTSEEAQNRLDQYKQQIKQIRELGITAQKKQQVQILDNVDEEVRQKFKGMKQDINAALTQGQLAMQQLNRQIQALDELHKVGNDNASELKRIKNGLNTLLRGVMTDKCTCLLIILLLLGIIAVVVIYFVRKNQNKQA